jgi:hypothetical protein
MTTVFLSGEGVLDYYYILFIIRSSKGRDVGEDGEKE